MLKVSTFNLPANYGTHNQAFLALRMQDFWNIARIIDRTPFPHYTTNYADDHYWLLPPKLGMIAHFRPPVYREHFYLTPNIDTALTEIIALTTWDRFTNLTLLCGRRVTLSCRV